LENKAMATYQGKQPFEIFLDSDGSPLENGYIWIGEQNQNPITHQLPVAWDPDGLYPAAQPIRTINGYASNNGSISNFFIFTTDANYSILVKNKSDEIIFSGNNGQLLGQQVLLPGVISDGSNGIIVEGQIAVETAIIGDAIIKGPCIDVRAFMDGQSGRPTLESWLLNQDSVDIISTINAAIDSLPSEGGYIIFPHGICAITNPISDSWKRIEFRLFPDTVIAPIIDSDVFHLTASFSRVIGGKIDGSGIDSGSGNGIVIGYGGANSQGCDIKTWITEMRGHGLVWEHGAFLRTNVLINNCDGDGFKCTSNYNDNNHGILIAHISNCAGLGFNIEDGAITSNRSRHHELTMVKCFGCTLGGALINSHGNTGHLMLENNIGNALEFGANGYGNFIQINGVVGVVHGYIDNSSGGNIVWGVDGNNEPTFNKLQGQTFKIRKSEYIGGFNLSPTADNQFAFQASNTSTDVKVIFSKGTASSLSVTVQDGDLVIGDKTSKNFLQNIASGGLYISKFDGTPYLDFRSDAGSNYDCRIRENSQGLDIYTHGNGSPGIALTIDSSKNITAPNGSITGTSLHAGNGASGSFTSQDGKTITVVDGVITSII
jgi:hypothetical protein